MVRVLRRRAGAGRGDRGIRAVDPPGWSGVGSGHARTQASDRLPQESRHVLVVLHLRALCTLAVCSTCGAYEGSLTIDCPGERVPYDRQQEVYTGGLEYTDELGWHQDGRTVLQKLAAGVSVRAVTVVLAVDPSIASPGAALFRDRVLIAATRLIVPVLEGESRGRRVRRAAAKIIAWAWPQIEPFASRPDVIVYEWPQIYRASKSKGDPNDLVALTAVGAAVAIGLCGVDSDCADVTPEPDEWTGGLPKTVIKAGKRVLPRDPWTSPRGRRIASRLSPAERALVPDSHDAIDSVGLGLWYLDRLSPVRVFPGAT